MESSSTINYNRLDKFVRNRKKIFLITTTFIVLVILLVVLVVPKKSTYDHRSTTNSYTENTLNTLPEYDINPTSTLEIEKNNFNYSNPCYLVDNNDVVDYIVDSKKGSYAFFLDYKIMHNGFFDSTFQIKINEIVVLDKISLKAFWVNSSHDFKTDSYGNEIAPTQQLYSSWINNPLYDDEYSTCLPYLFDLIEGENKISLISTSPYLTLIGKLKIKPTQELFSYNNYLKNITTTKQGETKEIQGEHFLYKNDTQPIPSYEADINVLPYDTNSNKLNTISNFSQAGEEITYQVEVEEGLYSISINGKNANSNHTTFISLLIDNKLPFGEMSHYPIDYSNKIINYQLKNENNENYIFYLTKGIHTISIKIDQSLTYSITTTLANYIDKLNEIYLSLKRIAGTSSDQTREWDLDSDIPGIKEKLDNIVSSLKNIKQEIYKINGATINFVASSSVDNAIKSLEGILEKPKYIPNQYAKFSEGSSSIIQYLANAREDLKTTPLIIDRIVLGPSQNTNLIKTKSTWFTFTEHIKKFFNSFFRNYSISSNEDKVINVWVARSRQYVDLMQQLIDESSFEKDTGYKVKFTILSDEGKLILANAGGVSPNAVMGISNWLPYEMGIRGLLVDLSKYEDYGKTIKRFSKGALINLISDGIALGLPETQDFYVMYYRKDILSSYNFSLPNTWDDVINLLPRLERNGFNFYIPLSTSTASKSIMTTAPFIFQNGGTLFSNDGKKTTIDDSNSIDAIKLMTELYTYYGMQTQVSNFFNSFRNGSLPIGVSTFDTYVKLSIAAPEIENKWGIALSPGIKDNNQINRYQTGSSTSMSLLDSKDEKKNAAGWELLKWWSSSTTQSEFATRLSLLYGKGYIWNSANLEAFNNSIIFTSEDKQIILNQWEYLHEIPKVPGWYMLERELSNSWNNIVLNGQNVRSVISNATTIINKELQKKLTEFGYIDAKGNDIKKYQMTTIDIVESYLK